MPFARQRRAGASCLRAVGVELLTGQEGTAKQLVRTWPQLGLDSECGSTGLDETRKKYECVYQVLKNGSPMGMPMHQSV